MDVIKFKVELCIKVVNLYEDILNCYNLDFYTEDHWNKLPKSWKELAQRDLSTLSNLLVGNCQLGLYPLSILALKKLDEIACVSRNFHDNEKEIAKIDSKLQKELKRKVKLKKLHEVQKMSKICYKIASNNQINNVIDFGSGLGHLARCLSFCYNLNVCCIERQNQLTEQAKRLDNEISKNHFTKSLRHHLNTELGFNSNFNEILIEAQNTLKSSSKFGLIGLHPCGDLAVLLLKNFLKYSDIRFINIVGCCYMKLTLNSKDNLLGYPLSFHVQNNKTSKLSYEMLEMACHANEKYSKKLMDNDYHQLKIHSFRAALEKIIVKYRKDLKHSGLKSVQHNDNMTFNDYCNRALRDFDFQAPIEEINSREINDHLSNWKQVVIFQTLRLILAPFIESIVLYDRILFLQEHECTVNVTAAFDPKISPRCHVMTAIKNS